MPIHFLVSSDEILDDYAWTKHRIRAVEICPWHETDDRIYTDEDEICDLFYDEVLQDEELKDKNINDVVEQMYKKVGNAICVFTEAS